MVTFVVIHNFVLGILCLIVAWKMGKLRRKLSYYAERLVRIEQIVYNYLHPAPDKFLKAYTGTLRLRQTYARLELKVEQMQQILKILSLGQLLWRWRPAAQPRRDFQGRKS